MKFINGIIKILYSSQSINWFCIKQTFLPHISGRKFRLTHSNVCLRFPLNFSKIIIIIGKLIFRPQPTVLPSSRCSVCTSICPVLALLLPNPGAVPSVLCLTVPFPYLPAFFPSNQSYVTNILLKNIITHFTMKITTGRIHAQIFKATKIYSLRSLKLAFK